MSKLVEAGDRLYGEVDLSADGKWWLVRCEPHVRARLKRVFPRANQYEYKAVRLLNTPDSSRDLLWFLARFPMSFASRSVERALNTGSKAQIALETRTSQLLSGNVPPSSFDLARPLREYQALGASVALTTGGTIIADDLGLGKTVTAIALTAHAGMLPALVVVQSHLQSQWRDKFAEFAPNLLVHVVTSGAPYDLTRVGNALRRDRGLPEKGVVGAASPRGGRARSRNAMAASGALASVDPSTMPDVLIITYGKLAGWADVLMGVIRYIVFDEVQELRNEDSAKYAAAHAIASQAVCRMGLSATPSYNYGSEYFNILDCLRPGALGAREEFNREWCEGGSVKDPVAFHHYLVREGMLVVHTRAEVKRELPPLEKVVFTVDADAAPLARAKSAALDLARTVVAANERFRGERMNAAERLDTLLRQATGVAKAPHVANFVKILMQGTPKVVLFGWHREVYSVWMEMLAEFNPRLYTGSESTREKEAAKSAFVDGDCRVLIVSLRSGSGLDGLQHVCNVAVIGELDWAAGVMEQCIGRVDRDGQERSTLAYILVSEDGADPVMVNTLGLKRAQHVGIRDGVESLVERMGNDGGRLVRLAKHMLGIVDADADEQASVANTGAEVDPPAGTRDTATLSAPPSIPVLDNSASTPRKRRAHRATEPGLFDFVEGIT